MQTPNTKYLHHSFSVTVSHYFFFLTSYSLLWYLLPILLHRDKPTCIVIHDFGGSKYSPESILAK